jgi:type I restriction enzyme, S subunit
MKKGWETKKLSALYHIGSSKRVLKSQWKTSGVPFYRGREVTRLASDGFVDNELFVSEEHFAELSKQTGVPQVGDIVLTAIGTIGNSHVVRDSDRFYFKDASVLWMKRAAEVSSEFVNLWLKSPLFFDQLDRGNGATVDTLTIQKLQSVELQLPPLAEQQRIVGLLDEAFAGIATAKANAEKNLQNVGALFESHLQSVFTQRGSGWVEKHLKDICEKITDGTHQTPKYFDDGVVFLSSRNVTSGRINWENIKYIDTKQHLEMHKRVAPRLNDILLAKNGTTGVAAIVDRDVTFDIYVSLALLRAREEILAPLLLHFINSPVAKQQFNKRLKGIGVPNLHLEEIREVVISFPKSLTKQKAVATKLDQLREETQRLASLYERKLATLEALKKSLLHQAFTGKL